MGYKFFFDGGNHNSYFFETNLEVIYEVKFKPTPYLFGNQQDEISDYIFELAVLVSYNPNEKFPFVDKKIGATVVAIFIDFYSKTGKAVTIYICDSSDGKQLVRKRKFDRWFSEFNHENFIKIDETLIDNNKNKFPISLILSKSNPFKLKIIEALFLITEDNTK